MGPKFIALSFYLLNDGFLNVPKYITNKIFNICRNIIKNFTYETYLEKGGGFKFICIIMFVISLGRKLRLINFVSDIL